MSEGLLELLQLVVGEDDLVSDVLDVISASGIDTSGLDEEQLSALLVGALSTAALIKTRRSHRIRPT